VSERPRQPFIDRDFYSDPRRRARSAITRALERPLHSAGFDFEIRSFYSPIPALERLGDEVFERRSPLAGIRPFDLDAQLRLIEEELAPFIAEFDPPAGPSGDRFTYHLENGLFQGGDADLLYAMIRRHKPRRVLELGAGFSTLVSAAAVRANRAEGHETALISCDPYAIPPPPGAIDGLAEILAVAAEDLGPEQTDALGAGDILFIDSSHTVRTGGDVVHLLLDVVPALAPGVLVHVHDVFLPYEYPREWLERNRWYWAEQYLLQALLVGNERLEVLIAAHALFRERPEALGRAIPHLQPEHPPLSFWMRAG
jgi:hypothetical protein